MRSKVSFLSLTIVIFFWQGISFAENRAEKSSAEARDELFDIDETADIELSASSSELNNATGYMIFSDVTVTQGPLKVRAKKGEVQRQEDDSSIWTLTGQVVVTNLGARITADRGIFHIHSSQIEELKFFGSPVKVEHKNLKDKFTQMRAEQIEYDIKNQFLFAENNAWFSDGVNETFAHRLSYDIKRGFITAESGDKGHVRMLLVVPPKKK